MAREAGRDLESIEITSFGLGEDLDRVKRLAEAGVTRVVPMFPPEADGLPPIEKSTPPAMIADFEAQCVLGDDPLWRIQSQVLQPIFVGRGRPFSVSVDPERLGARST